MVEVRRPPGVTVARRAVLAVAFTAALPRVRAAGAPRRPRLGVLSLGINASSAAVVPDLRDGLAALGWVDDRTLAIEWRTAGGRPDRLAPLAHDLLNVRCDVLFAGGPGPLAVLRQATAAVPIVTVSGSDPVREGWAKSLAQPAGNVTGLTVTYPGVGPKRLAILHDALPAVHRVAVLMAPAEVDDAASIDPLREAASGLGLMLVRLDARQAGDFERLFADALAAGAQAILTIETPLLVANRRVIGELAAKGRLPIVGELFDFGTGASLLTYGASLRDLLRRAATPIDRVLRGTPPGEIPIERPTVLELVINAGTARSMDIELPPSVKVRADRVLE